MIAVASTFTSELLRAPLAFWIERLGWSDDIAFAGYNQVLQSLADPNGVFLSGASSANVILIRVEDWQRFIEAPRDGIVESAGAEFVAAVRSASTRTTAPFVVVLCQPSAATAAGAAQLHDDIAGALRGLPNVFTVRWEEIAERYGCRDALDARSDELGHVPYTDEGFAAIATAVIRRLFAIRSAPKKVLVLDCDQTLWSGVIGEDGVAGVQVDAARGALQREAQRLRSSGFLLCLCSKNNETDVWELFDAKRPDMVLGRDDIDAWRIDWRDKADNIRELARELELGLDSFIFIDDSGLECARMRAACPEVTTIQLPESADEIRDLLDHVWVFDRLSVTTEDRERGRMYREQRARESLRLESGTLGDFLASLDLQVDVAAPQPADFARVAQLTQRTNQFNATTIRRSETEIAHLLADGSYECWAIRVRDRFGDYGLVGVVLFRTDAERLDVDTFLLSCRVLGRGVEHQLLARLGRVAGERGATTVQLRFAPTPRNQPARDFLASTLGDLREPSGSDTIYRVPAARAAAVAVRVDQAPAAPVRESARGADAGAARAASELAAEILGLRTGRAIVERCGKPASAAPAGSSIEAVVARVLSDLLEIDDIDPNADFYSLGGDSLKGLQALARIHRELAVKLPIDAIFAGECSVARLVARIRAQSAEP